MKVARSNSETAEVYQCSGNFQSRKVEGFRTEELHVLSLGNHGLGDPGFRSQYVFENKPYKIAEYILFGLFPFALANKDLANNTKRWLERNQKAEHTLRRLVKENLGILERALAAQAVDKAATFPSDATEKEFED